MKYIYICIYMYIYRCMYLYIYVNKCVYIFVYMWIYVKHKLGDRNQGLPEGSLFNSYYTKV